MLNSTRKCVSLILVKSSSTRFYTQLRHRRLPCTTHNFVQISQPLNRSGIRYKSQSVETGKNNVHNGKTSESKTSQVTSQPAKSSQRLGEIERKLAIIYTCTVCNHRSSKTFSRLSYEKGVVIIKCPECNSNHLIADNLGWFEDVKHKLVLFKNCNFLRNMLFSLNFKSISF